MDMAFKLGLGLDIVMGREPDIAEALAPARDGTSIALEMPSESMDVARFEVRTEEIEGV